MTSSKQNITQTDHHLSRLEKVHVEPYRKSILDSLRDNLRICERSTYVHRLIYIGEHAYENVSLHLKDAFDKIINTVNDSYCDEQLTGYFFYHMRYFCHFVEGSEEVLMKHLHPLFTNEKLVKQLGRMKLLIVYNHINQRILDEWMAVTAKPPTLLERIDMNANLSQTMEKVKYCVEKLYGLGTALRPVDILIEEKQSEAIEEKKDPTRKSVNLYGQVVNPIYTFLPELTILEFLLSSKYLRNLHNYFQTFGNISPLDAYEELVWPIPPDFVPMNLYEQEIDPVADLTVQIPQ